MRKMSRRPGVKKKLVLRLQDCRVFIVDAFGLRESSRQAEEFTLQGTKSKFPGVIPANEIWISRRHFSSEGIFLLTHALTDLAGRKRGLSEEDADESALQVERSLREAITGEKFRHGRSHKQVPNQLYDSLYTTIPDPEGEIEVWLIDGHLARCWYKTDYAEGGHYVVYPWVPKREIWLERAQDPRELPFICVHEYLELRMMRDNDLPYDDAHPIASKIEFGLRREKLDLPLESAGRLSKADLPGLASPAVYEFVLRRFLNRR
jgi:hypothetical protein